MSSVAARLQATARTSWKTASVAIGGGLLIEALLPVGAPWLPALAALAFAALSVLLFRLAAWVERRPPGRRLPEVDERALDRPALLERWSTPAQFAYAFGAGALFLLALSLGFGVGHLLGFGSPP
jgi:hypothetical protein